MNVRFAFENLGAVRCANCLLFCAFHNFLQVFSANEEIEEIATQVLPMLATDFYLGSLMIKLPFTSPQVSGSSRKGTSRRPLTLGG